MLHEHNKDKLKEALQQMRSFSPPDGLWEKISAGMEESSEDQQVLNEAVDRLPGYTPPVSVWNRLTRVLDQDADQRKLRVLRRRQVLAWAAVVALLISATAWLWYEPGPKVSLQYAQETVQEFKAAQDWNADEPTFAKLEEVLAEVNDPTINKLRLEYEELSTAHQDVEAMLVSYGQDPQLIRQMAEIERERTDIYRQIIEQI